jgi:DNA-binding protein HU-beta
MLFTVPVVNRLARAGRPADPGRWPPRLGSATWPDSEKTLIFGLFCLHPGAENSKHSAHMAKALTKSQIAASIAENTGITKKQSAEILEAIAQLAYKNAKNTFTFPGLGKLVLVNRKARMGRNPATGEEIKIPAKRVVKFRVAKAAKDAILGAR